MADQFVLLGLAHTRSRWFRDVARWSVSGMAPVEFVKCLSVDEAAAVAGAGRRLSALLVDASFPHFDRDLVATVSSAGAVTFVVDDGRTERDWEAIGAKARLDSGFECNDLMDALHRHAVTVDRNERTSARIDLRGVEGAPIGRLVGVTGAGGCGSSTLAMALAQSLSRECTVALADGARRSDLAMYHDIGDVLPGLTELVDIHRSDEPDPEMIRSHLFEIPARGYDLLLGLCRGRDWAAMRPRSVASAIHGLRRSYDLVVIDHDPDVEGETETGSIEVEERHAVARTVAARADLMLVVSRPGLKGLHDLVRLTGELRDAGVPDERIVPVMNQAPRNPALRAELSRSFQQLVDGGRRDGSRRVPVLFVRTARLLDEAHRRGAAMPDGLGLSLARTTMQLLDRVGRRPTDAAASGSYRRVLPGELGTGLDLTGEVA